MNYRNYEEFSDEMCRKLGKLKIQEVKIERLEMSGFISGKRAIYAKQVAMFDFTLCEAKGLAVLNLFDKIRLFFILYYIALLINLICSDTTGRNR